MRLQEHNDSAIGVGWWADKLRLWNFRIRAARYAFHLQATPKATAVLKFLTMFARAAGAVVSVLIALGLLQVLSQVQLIHPSWGGHAWWVIGVGVGVVVAALFAVGSVLKYYAHVPRLMEWASVTDKDAVRMRENTAAGMRNIEGYRQLRALYEENVEDANDFLAQSGYSTRFHYVNRDDSLRNSPGSHYGAVAVLPADGNTTLRNVLGLVLPVTDEWTFFTNRLAESRQQLTRQWGKTDGKRRSDDESVHNYILRNVAVDFGGQRVPKLRLDVGVATYGQILRTCESLLNEYALFAYLTGTERPVYKDPRPPSRPGVGLMLRRLVFSLRSRLNRSPGRRGPHRREGAPELYLRKSIPMRPRTMLKCLPWRAAVHHGVENPRDLFLQPGNRAAGIGVAIATAKPIERHDDSFLAEAAELGVVVAGAPRDDDEKVALWIAWRSSMVGTNPGVLHVVPAGMCKTRDAPAFDHTPGSHVEAWYLTAAMKSEFMEEWLNNKDLENASVGNWRGLVDGYWKRGGSVNGQYVYPIREITPLTYTGLAFDLLTLRPEICAYVQVEQFRSRLNWEYKEGTPPISVEPDGPLVTDMSRIVQSGAASLLLGSELYKECRRSHTGQPRPGFAGRGRSLLRRAGRWTRI